MSGTTSTTIQAAIKEVVLEKIFKGFKEDNTLANYFNWDGGGDIEVNDRGVRSIPYLRPNPSGGYFSQAGGLAVTGNQTFVAATCAYTRYSMGAAYSGDAIKQMNSPAAVEKGMAPYMRRDKTTMLNNFEQDLFEAGTGTKAITNVNYNALSTTTQSFYTTVAGGSTYGARRLLIGGRYNWINPATGVARSGGGTVSTVTAIADSTTVVTFDFVPTDVLSGDLLVRENTYNAAPRGLAYAVSSNSLTIFNIDRSIYPEWNSNQFDAGGIAMTFSIARRMDYILDVRCTDGQSKIVDKFVSVPMYQAMEEVYNPLVRVPEQGGQRNLGMTGIDIGGSGNVTRLHWVQDDHMWYIKKDTWYKAFLEGPTLWEDLNGNIFHPEPQVSATGSGGSGIYKDNQLMWYVFRGDMFCVSPRDNGVTLNVALTSQLVRPYSIGR